MRNNKGFTLIEIVVTLGISLIMILAIYAVINSAQRSSAGLERRVAAQQDEKAALELMSMEIRMASYNPNLTRGNWVTWNACSTVSGNQDYLGIQEATSTSITVEMDINESCTTDNNPACMSTSANPNEVIRYNYDMVNLYITRETNCGGAQPFLGDTQASGRTRTVRVINGNTIPVFRYYNGAGTEIVAPVTAEIHNIRRIEITLAVETENIDPNAKSRKRIVYSTSVIARNHAPGL
jgi:prepilin-type N-terminal cleavage/methylation domain-containing protein